MGDSIYDLLLIWVSQTAIRSPSQFCESPPQVDAQKVTWARRIFFPLPPSRRLLARSQSKGAAAVPRRGENSPGIVA